MNNLFKSFSSSPILFTVVTIALIISFILVFKNKKTKKQKLNINEITIGALCITLSFILSYIKIVSMPFGGSLTAASMLPLMLYCYWFGTKKGLVACLAYGILQFIQEPIVFHPIQVILDYGAAFCVIALAGLCRNLYIGIGVAGIARFIIHNISGIIFFYMYAPEGTPVWIYSTVYNSVILVETLLCIIIAFAMNKWSVFDRLKISRINK